MTDSIDMAPAPSDHWTPSDVALLLETVRITAPYTPQELVKIHTFIGLLIEIKTGNTP